MKPRERRALWAGGALIGLIVLLGRIGPRAADVLRRTSSELDRRRTYVENARRRLAEAEALAAEVNAVRSEFLALAPLLLPGPDEIAASEAVEGLMTAAAGQRMTVGPVEYLGDSTTAGRLSRVAVRTGFESDLKGLLEFLARLESDDRVVRVRDLQILATNPLDPAHAEKLRGQLTLEGWLLPEHATEGAPPAPLEGKAK